MATMSEGGVGLVETRWIVTTGDEREEFHTKYGACMSIVRQDGVPCYRFIKVDKDRTDGKVLRKIWYYPVCNTVLQVLEYP